MDRKPRGSRKANNLQLYHQKTQRRFHQNLEEGRKCLEEVENHHQASLNEPLSVDWTLKTNCEINAPTQNYGAGRENEDLKSSSNSLTQIAPHAAKTGPNDSSRKNQERHSSREVDNHEEGRSSPVQSSSADSSYDILQNHHQKKSESRRLGAKRDTQESSQMKSGETEGEVPESSKKKFKIDLQASGHVYKPIDRNSTFDEFEESTSSETPTADIILTQSSSITEGHLSSLRSDHTPVGDIEYKQVNGSEETYPSGDELDHEGMNAHFNSSGGHSKKFTDLLNIIMFPASNMSVKDILNMAQAIYLRYNIPKAARYAILEMIKTIAGPGYENLNVSEYYVSNFSKPREDNKTFTFYCSECFETISDPLLKKNIRKSNPAKCDKCQEVYTLSTKNSNFYINMNVEYMMRSLLSNQEILDSLLNSVSKIREERKVDKDYITDVTDAEIYKERKFIAKHEECEIVLSADVNTDGSTMHETTSFSLWPIFLIINELPPKLRFKMVLLVAALYTNKEPNHLLMNSFMSSFLKQMHKLIHHGILIFDKARGRTIRIFVRPIFFVLDSVARPIVSARKQYNSLYGCAWCYIMGEFKVGSMRFLKKNRAPDRTQEEYLKDLVRRENEKVDKNGEKVFKGLRGKPDITELLYYFDNIWGYPPEYMHGVVIGGTKHFWEFLNKSVCPFKLTPKQVTLIDQRLTAIKPIKSMYRLPEQLKKKGQWKAADWLYWLIFYSIPCYRLILHPVVFKVHCLLVKSIRTLLASKIGKDALDACEGDLQKFVEECEELFGDEFMKFNIHLLLHLVASVRKSGPLWTSSAFHFESENGHLKDFVTGTTNVLEQITTHVLERNEFSNNVLNNASQEESFKFCRKIMSNEHEIIKHHRTRENAIVPFTEAELKSNRYSRCIYEKVAYHSTLYKRPQKTDDTFAELSDGRIVQILYFSLHNNECHAQVQGLDVIPVDVDGILIDHILIVTGKNVKSERIPITLIKKKMIHLQIVNDLEYVCHPLEVYHVQ